MSPNEIITVTRLKRAAELLTSGDLKIYEIAEKVGYSEASNFSRDFTRQFNIIIIKSIGLRFQRVSYACWHRFFILRQFTPCCSPGSKWVLPM
jgi:AraC-like DNA-binding protein